MRTMILALTLMTGLTAFAQDEAPASHDWLDCSVKQTNTKLAYNADVQYYESIAGNFEVSVVPMKDQSGVLMASLTVYSKDQVMDMTGAPVKIELGTVWPTLLGVISYKGDTISVFCSPK